MCCFVSLSRYGLQFYARPYIKSYLQVMFASTKRSFCSSYLRVKICISCTGVGFTHAVRINTWLQATRSRRCSRVTSRNGTIGIWSPRYDNACFILFFTASVAAYRPLNDPAISLICVIYLEIFYNTGCINRVAIVELLSKVSLDI